MAQNGKYAVKPGPYNLTGHEKAPSWLYLCVEDLLSAYRNQTESFVTAIP